MLECNRAVEDVENNIDGFKPEYYILLEKIGKHYKIIGYKHKVLFKYQELPFDLKLMISKAIRINIIIFLTEILDNINIFNRQKYINYAHYNCFNNSKKYSPKSNYRAPRQT